MAGTRTVFSNARIAGPGAGAEPASILVEDGVIRTVIPAGDDVSGGPAGIVDLDGAYVSPGFTDCHLHLAAFGRRTNEPALSGAPSFAEFSRIVRVAAASTDGWVFASGWDESKWPDRKPGEFPDRRELDALCPDNPCLLRRVDGHVAAANTTALSLAGIAPGSNDPPGGRFSRDEKGAPDGLLYGSAIASVRRLVPGLSKAERKRLLISGADALARLGLTCVHVAGCGYAREGEHFDDDCADYMELADAAELPLRAYLMVGGNRDDFGRAAENGRVVDYKSRVTIRGMKMLLDGALGAKTARLSEPYTGGGTGIWEDSPGEVEAMCRKAVESGFQPCIHAIGDEAVTAALDIAGKLNREFSGKDIRFRIEHAQIVRPEDLPRFQTEGVVASVQTAHAVDDARWAGDYLGAERLKWGYNWRGLIDAGATLCGGSDAPIADANPLAGIEAATTSKIRGGGEHPGKTISREEAVALYTTGAAYAAYEEDRRGRIAAGFRADFTVLDRDIFACPANEIRNAEVVATIVAGECVYKR